MTNIFAPFWNWLRREDLVEDLTLKLNTAKLKIDDILLELNKLQVVDDIEDRELFWNNKWAKAKVIYKAREDNIKFDVRNFITYPDGVLKDVLTNNKLVGDTEDKTVLNIINWVNAYLTYESDSTSFGFNEQWDFPAEVLYRKKSDCEGYSHLIISLCRNAEIPAFKLKVACGFVKQGSGIVGHSYPIYLRDDDEWVAIEGSYHSNNTSINQRVPVREDVKYNPVEDPIWFTFNDIYSWGNRSLTLSPGDV